MGAISFFKMLGEKLHSYFMAGLLTVMPMAFTLHVFNVLFHKTRRNENE